MIAGATNAGKTTLLRALANEIPPTERLITVERALELGLDQFPELHPNVVALEERLPNSEGHGEITMAELVRRSLRMNPSRVIVGEVLGDEIVTMLNAMTQGNDGSLSTIHANSSMEVFNRISTYALQSAERLPVEATHMLIAGAIDFVVFIEKRNEYAQRRPAAPVRAAASARSPGSTGGCCPVRCSRRARTAARCRTRRSPAPRSSPARLRRRAAAGERAWLAGPLLAVLLRARWPAAACSCSLIATTRSAAPAAGTRRNAAGASSCAASVRAARRGGRARRRRRAGGHPLAGGRGGRGHARASAGAGCRRRGQRAPGDGPAGGAGHLDRVAARHDRRRGRPGAGHPGLAAGRRAVLRPSRWPRWSSRLHTRVPLPDALRMFADDLDDPGRRPVVAALILNARLRGPGLRDVLGSLSASAREELDMRRQVERGRAGPPGAACRSWCWCRSGLRSCLAVFDHGFLAPYDSAVRPGCCWWSWPRIFAAGFVWLRRLAHFEAPQRLLSAWVPEAQAGPADRRPAPAPAPPCAGSAP